MKKLVFPMLVALVAAISFTSCNKEVTDEDLIKNITKYETYVGVDNEGDAVTASFTSTGFNIVYDDPEYAELYYAGTWTVKDGQLILTGDEVWAPGIIENDGKNLTLTSGTLTISLTKK
jgi:hypothetical protein